MIVGMRPLDTLIIGGGQAGLAAAHTLITAGRQPVLVEASAQPAGSWPNYYDSLTLFSPARFSSLPGRPFPGDPDHYPHRDEVVDYLLGYAAGLDADIRTHTQVTQVTTTPDGFAVRLADASTLTAATVIATTGGFGTPNRPALPGLTDFAGTVLHTADYRNPKPFTGCRVAVVGGGNSAVQIAAELATVARVTLATRSPLRFAAPRLLGHDVHWWAVRSGLDAVPIGGWLRRRGLTAPVSDDGRYRAALDAGNPDRRPMFTSLDADGVIWPDGRRERIDVVLLATGYRPRLGYLAGTGALDTTGQPLHRGGVSTTVPGLGYVGLEFQRSFGSNTLRGVGRDARHVTRHLHRRPRQAAKNNNRNETRR